MEATMPFWDCFENEKEERQRKQSPKERQVIEVCYGDGEEN